MTVASIIEEIKKLSPDKQAQVIRFAYELDPSRRLSGKELTTIAERLACTQDPTEALLAREAILRGFYSEKQGA